jgi:hypothetical protein
MSLQFHSLPYQGIACLSPRICEQKCTVKNSNLTITAGFTEWYRYKETIYEVQVHYNGTPLMSIQRHSA